MIDHRGGGAEGAVGVAERRGVAERAGGGAERSGAGQTPRGAGQSAPGAGQSRPEAQRDTVEAARAVLWRRRGLETPAEELRGGDGSAEAGLAPGPAGSCPEMC